MSRNKIAYCHNTASKKPATLSFSKAQGNYNDITGKEPQQGEMLLSS